jgi:hypothetical protein
MTDTVNLGAGETIPGPQASHGAKGGAGAAGSPEVTELAQFQAIIRAKWSEYEKALVRNGEASPAEAKAICKASADAACAELRQTMTGSTSPHAATPDAATRDLTAYPRVTEPLPATGRSL